MAWDFSTDPGVQEYLDWMRACVREEIWPPETLVPTRREAARRKFGAVTAND